MCFTKGLDHCKDTGLISNKEDFEQFRRAIDEGFIDPFTSEVPPSPSKDRGWEAPTAGITYDLQGPDAQAVTMDPAPTLGSDELAYEMAEVYELALLRDVHFKEFNGDDPKCEKIKSTLDRLNSLKYTEKGFPNRPRINKDGLINSQNLFRGSSPNVEIGPYLSQFLLIGNDLPGDVSLTEGLIEYGALTISQKVPVAKINTDYLTSWENWLEAQNGKKLLNTDTLFDKEAGRRFISTPRDLATYVHFDALYEAYLNACLILLSMKTPFAPGFSNLSGQGSYFLNSLDFENPNHIKWETHQRAANGFALYGGPHILTLVTEVATRALKAVRFQKFNTHIRLRPEALSGRIEKADVIEDIYKQVGDSFSKLRESIAPTVSAIQDLNPENTALLPMAFQEGSPMHPSYGAGHATVAGACVTILKAFFDTDTVFVCREGKSLFDRYKKGDSPIEYVPSSDGSCLDGNQKGSYLTLEGELNKLAANISIGRNMAGVHYYSDYYDSLRMGEQIAIGILEEQALCYPTDPFVLTVPTFDGDVVRIGTR